LGKDSLTIQLNNKISIKINNILIVGIEIILYICGMNNETEIISSSKYGNRIVTDEVLDRLIQEGKVFFTTIFSGSKQYFKFYFR
jgi:hypothetical protein